MTEQVSKKIKVSATTPVPSLSGSIIKSIELGEKVELRACGAGAVNQMFKGIACARGTLATKGRDVLIRPGFDEVDEDGARKTIMVARLVIE